MYDMLVTWLTVHTERSPLKEVHPRNMYPMSVVRVRSGASVARMSRLEQPQK